LNRERTRYCAEIPNLLHIFTKKFNPITNEKT
jgi:hypothetical protein